MMEFYKRKISVAKRVPHTCHICNHMIMLHEKYVSEAGKYKGEFFSRESHIHCSKVIQNFLADYCVTEYDDDSGENYAREKYCAECDQLEVCNKPCALACDRIMKLIELGG